MNFLRSIITLSLIVFQAHSLFSQDTVGLNTLIEKNHQLTQTYPTEKVYLHFDKPYYALGDTIWFKGYLASEQNRPSDLSKVLYVDILASNDTLVRSLRLPVVNTSAYGSVVLDPALYKSGNYRVRAYTYWMLNFSETYFFQKNLPVGNALTRKVITQLSLKGEDGDQSPKIKARIVYKDPEGRPLANRKISWKLISKFNEIAKGKETTDAQGVLSLLLSASQKAVLDTGILETVLEGDNGQAITSKFPLKNAFADADIQFFPEGGELIAGIAGKVGFKALQEKGLGLAVKGQVKDQSGTVVTTLEARHLGMGSFSLKPEAGKNYQAEVEFANGIKKSFALPAVKPSGITLMAVNTGREDLLVKFAANTPYFAANQNKNYYIIARSKGVICYAAQTRLSTPSITAAIPKNKFPAGIVQLTLFSDSGEPLTERLIFSKPDDVLTLSVTTDKKLYGGRQPVKMTVNAKARNSPVQGNFSVSVVNETMVPFSEDNEITILSSFLLSSDLQGYVEKPNYYFHGVNDKKLEDLDVLMLTQGYRKFFYKDILAGNEPNIKFLPEQGIEVNGILRSSNGSPVSKGSLRLVVPDNRFQAEVKTNAKGEFKFENVQVRDSSEVTISARGADGARNMRIMVNGTAFPEIKRNVNAADEILNLDSVLSPYLENSKRQYRMASQLLQEVVIESTVLTRPSHKDYPALTGLSPTADHLIDGSRLKGCNLLTTCLQTSATGLVFADNNFYVARVYNSGLQVPVQIFYNGTPVDVSYLNAIVPADIESVEVFLKDEMGLINRTYNTNGVLVINGKKNASKPVTAEDLKKLFPPDNVMTFTPLGYLKTREFYSPKYSTAASKTAGSDLRTTIYWNPKVFTDQEGNFSFDFYNSDNKGSYKATVEGTDIEGNLARFVYRYKVQ